LVGEDGADTIEGFDGSDALVGGVGGDVLTGGRGIDGYYGQGGDDLFIFRATDLEAGVRDYLWDYSNVAGNNDQIRFEGIAQGSVSYAQQGSDVIISIALTGGGVATILAANTTVATVQADIQFP
jgi:Ca2+-binding RTX toxin-like protein